MNDKICARDTGIGDFEVGTSFACKPGCGMVMWNNGKDTTPLTPFTLCKGTSLLISGATEVIPVEVVDVPEGNTFTVALGE